MNFRSCFALAVVTSLTACQTAQPRPQAPVAAADFLVRRPAFTQCELEGFMSLTAARNALVFGSRKESLIAGTSTSPFRTAMVEDLYVQKASGHLKNHPSFAAQKFYECSAREQLGLAPNPGGAAICLARLDIVFYLDVDRRKGRAQSEALARFKKSFPDVPKSVFPDDLVEKIAPMVFRITSEDGEYELRRFVFETCLFPDGWKQWWDAVGSKES